MIRWSSLIFSGTRGNLRADPFCALAFLREGPFRCSFADKIPGREIARARLPFKYWTSGIPYTDCPETFALSSLVPANPVAGSFAQKPYPHWLPAHICRAARILAANASAAPRDNVGIPGKMVGATGIEPVTPPV
jgi:hypothetical protein